MTYITVVSNRSKGMALSKLDLLALSHMTGEQNLFFLVSSDGEVIEGYAYVSHLQKKNQTVCQNSRYSPNQNWDAFGLNVPPFGK